MSLALACMGAERNRDAVLVYGEAADMFRKSGLPLREADAFGALARTYSVMKDSAQARRTIDHALDVATNAGQGASLEFADLLEISADLYRDSSSANLQREYDRAIAIREHLWKRTDPRFVGSIRNIASMTRWGTSKDYAEKLYRRIVTIEKEAHPGPSEERYKALFELARYLHGQDALEEADALLQEAYQLRLRMGKKDLSTAECLYEIASCRLSRKKYGEAAENGRSALAIQQSLEKPDAFGTLRIHALIAEAALKQGQPQKAEESFIELSQRALPTNRFLLIDTADKLASLYEERQELPKAAAKLELALATAEMAGPNRPSQADRMARLAVLYQQMGRLDDANRMNAASISEMARSANPSGQNVLIGIGLVILFAPWVGTLITGLLFRWRSRRLDRSIATLYEPPRLVTPQGLVQPEVAEPIATSDALGTAEETLAILPAPTDPLTTAELIEPAASEVPPPEPVTTTNAEAESPKPVPVTQVHLQADGSVLFAMRVLNLLLSMLTLGIYSFWGKAKVRRYVCGDAEYQGDRFAFHGTGKELLLGWLRAVPALAFVFLFPNILPLVWQHPNSIYVAQAAALLAFLLLWPLARVGAYRYRLNRMSWRAIRFSYRGSGARYLLASGIGVFLSVVTLGLYGPWLQVRLRRLLFNQTYFGDRKLEFSGNARHLFWVWFFALPLCICSFGIGWAWWSALRHRYCWAHTTFAGGRFRCSATGGKLLRLYLGNFIIVVFTVGFGMTWAMLRTLRFWTTHVALVGDSDVTGIRQDNHATSATAESFADFLGFDFGF